MKKDLYNIYMKIDNINNVYEIAKNTFNGKVFTFQDLIKLIQKNDKEALVLKNVGEFYNNLLEDPRFVFIGGRSWKLRDFLTFEEQKNVDKMLYNLKQSSDINKNGENNLSDSNVQNEIEDAEEENDDTNDEAKLTSVIDSNSEG